MRTLRAVGLLVATALVSVGCGFEGAPAGNEGDCHVRIGVDGKVLDPVGASPAGRRGDVLRVDVLDCDEERVTVARARPVTRDGELLGYEVAGGDGGFYSTDSVVGPTG